MDNIKQIIVDINKIIQNPFGSVEKGRPSTFIPKYPEIILLLNMVDLADAKGIKTDYDKLAKELNVTILPIIALFFSFEVVSEICFIF